MKELSTRELQDLHKNKVNELNEIIKEEDEIKSPFTSKEIVELSYAVGNIDKEFEERKETIRQYAKDTQQFIQSMQCLSYGEIAVVTFIFESLAQEYGLTDEFKENGII